MTPLQSLILAAAVPAAVLLPAGLFAAPTPGPLPSAPPDIEVTLVAREPLLRNPCALAFDSQGRLFVGQGPQYRNPKPTTPGDTIELLIDSDGDGVFDRTRTFAKGLNCIQGLAWRGRDLYVANSPDLTIVRDLDGDDVADEYVLLYTDLGNIEHALHGLNFAPDGRLYMSKGNSKGLNQPGRTAPKAFLYLFGQTPLPGAPDIPPARVFTPETYRATYQDPNDDWGRMGGILRSNPDGSGLEIVSRGLRNPWDIGFDSEFNWLGTDNDQSDGDRILMPFFGADYGWAHTWSPDWTGRSHLPTVPISGPVFTGSGTGVVFADNTALPAAYRGVWFINDFQHRITYMYRPSWDGALLQPAGGKWQPFLRPGDALFNPVDIDIGPDGALYLTGWGTALGAEFKNGQQTNEGRLWRITAKEKLPGTDRLPSRKGLRQEKRTFAELAQDLASPVAAFRSDASFELVRRGREMREPLAALARRPGIGSAQETWALWTLGRIDRSDESLDRFFSDESVKLTLNARIQSIGILGYRHRETRRTKPLPQFVIGALNSTEPRARFAAFQAIEQAPHSSLLDPVLDATAVETDRIAYYAAWRTLLAVAGPEELRRKLGDPRAGVRRAALLGLLSIDRLDEAGIRTFLKDSDPASVGLAGLWLAKRSGNPLLDVSPPPGDFVGSARVKIVPGLKPAVVRFTTDGSEPTYAPGDETARVTLTETTTLKVALFVDGKKVGGTSTGVYRRIIPPPPPPPAQLTAPAIPVTLQQVMAALPSADFMRGRSVFHAAGCAACHRVGAEGGAFGPDLSEMAARGNVERVIRSILEPNAEIVEGFSVHTYALRNGRSYAGRILEESQSSFALVQPDNEVVTIMRSDVVQTVPMPASAMPAFDRVMSAAELASLVSWLTKPHSP